jgi:hypothetical protein
LVLLVPACSPPSPLTSRKALKSRS